MTPKAKAIKSQTKKLLPSEGAISKRKRQHIRNGRKYLQIIYLIRGYYSKVDKEPMQLNRKKKKKKTKEKTNSIKNGHKI